MVERLSIIIPTSFRHRPLNIFDRVRRLVSEDMLGDHEVVIVHEATGHPFDAPLRALLESRDVKLCWVPSTEGRISIGGLRNRGAEAATGSHLLFYDVDLVVGPDFFPRAFAALQESPRPFLIIPCLYGTKAGARRLAPRRRLDDAAALDAVLGYRRDLVAIIALNTSTILLDRETFDELDAFDSRYLDHGLEDFDLLLRLALRFGRLPIPSDLLADTPSASPAFSEGFRAYLNLFSLPVFLGGLFTFHMPHSRPLSSAYYHHREENRRIFESNVSGAAESARLRGDAVEFRELVDREGKIDGLLSTKRLIDAYGDPALVYDALFDNSPAHLHFADRRWRRIRKRLRQLLGRDPATNRRPA